MFFSIRNIACYAMMLAILILMVLIKNVIPSLPNGLGSVFLLFEAFVIIFACTIGTLKTIFVLIIFYSLAWINTPLFMEGLKYAPNGIAIAGSFFLDYLLPNIVLTFIGLVQKQKQRLWLIFILILIGYLFNVASGIIFWGQYAWQGWSVISYSIIANLIRTSVLSFIAPISLVFIVPRLNKHINLFLKEK